MTITSTNQFHAENGLPVKRTIVPRYENLDNEILIYIDPTGVNDFTVNKILKQEGDVVLLLKELHVILTGFDEDLFDKASFLKYTFVDKEENLVISKP